MFVHFLFQDRRRFNELQSQGDSV